MASFCSTNLGTPEQKIAYLVLSRKWTALPEVNKCCQTSLKWKNFVYVSADTNSFCSFKISSNQQWVLAPPQAPKSVPLKLFISTLGLPASKKNKSHGGFLVQESAWEQKCPYQSLGKKTEQFYSLFEWLIDTIQFRISCKVQYFLFITQVPVMWWPIWLNFTCSISMLLSLET